MSAPLSGPWQGKAVSSLGQNPESLSGEEVGAEGWVDAGSEAFASEGAARLIGFKDVVSGVADDTEIQRRSVFSGSAAVFVESHVHRPMQSVLDAPMGRTAARMA